MTLAQIRKIETREELAKAVRYFTGIQYMLGIGAAHAFKSTLVNQAAKLGISLKDLNLMAEQ